MLQLFSYSSHIAYFIHSLFHENCSIVMAVMFIKMRIARNRTECIKPTSEYKVFNFLLTQESLHK